MKVCGLETNFLDMGQGEALLLLHGWGGTSTSVLGLANELSTKYRVVVPDFWGFGKSQMPPSDFDVFSYAHCVAEFLNQLGIKKVSVLGHSFGGRVAIVLGAKYPTLIDKIVLIDSAGLKPRFSLSKYIKIKRYKKLKHQVQTGKKPEYVLQKYGSVDYKKLDGPFRQVFLNVVNQDLTGLLANINAQTLIVWGKKDKDTPPYMAKLLHKKLKCSKLCWLNGGHFAYLTQQKQTLKIVFEFLEDS